MNLLKKFEEKHLASLNKEIPDFRAGCTLRLGTKIVEGEKTRIQFFEGVCIKLHRRQGMSATYVVRKMSGDIGVERNISLYSPSIDSISLVRRGRVRRARLYFLRNRRGKSARIAELSSR